MIPSAEEKIAAAAQARAEGRPDAQVWALLNSPAEATEEEIFAAALAAQD